MLSIAALATVLGVALWARPALTQTMGEDRLMRELDATDRRIEQAEALVSTADNAVAESEVSIARELQSRARGEFGNHHFDMAGRLTFDARRHADRAIAMVRGLPDPDRVMAQLDRTRELMQRTRDRIEECDQDRARALVRAAADLQDRAEQATQAGRYLAALQLTMEARERARRALRLCRMEENLQEAAERGLSRTDAVIARVRERLEERGSDAARQALERAVELQSRAYGDFRSGYFESSLRRTQSARAMAYRAARLAGIARP